MTIQRRLTMFLVTATMIATTPVLASGLCDDVVLVEDAQTAFNPETGLFEGILRIALDGQVRNVRSSTFVLGIPTASPEGVLTSRTSHTWSLGQPLGKIVTIDENFLTPTGTPGVFDFGGQLEVETGTRYSCGLIVARGTIDLVNLTLDLPALDADGLPATAGRLCHCR